MSVASKRINLADAEVILYRFDAKKSRRIGRVLQLVLIILKNVVVINIFHSIINYLFICWKYYLLWL